MRTSENIVQTGVILILLLLIAYPVYGQPSGFSFDKAGRFIAPDQGLSLSRVHSRTNRYEGPQPFDVLHYRIELSLPLTSGYLEGKCTIVMRLKNSVDSIMLHAASLTLDTVRVDGIQKSISLYPGNETFTIHLGTLRSSGDTLHIVVSYRRLPATPRLSSRQGYYFFSDSIGIPSNLGYTFAEPSDARFWLPCYDEPWDKATADLLLTIPEAYVAASNGRLVGVLQNGNGTSTWHWREENTIATYLLCMTISKFSRSSINYERGVNDTIPLEYYAWQSDSADVRAFLPVVGDMMRMFEQKFGPYPFDKYGMTAIVPFTFLGMEHQTITTMNRFFRTSQRVTAHELAHQWWGDLVTCGTWPDIWLNEGFATYSEALWRESQGGFPALRSYMRDTLNGFHFGSWQGAIYNPVGQGFNLFDQVVYSKAAWVLHTLRGVVGDSVFSRILDAYRYRYAQQSAVTEELAAVVDSVTGTTMGWFFDQWIYGKGWPRYASSFSWMPDTVILTIYQMQSEAWPTYTMPIRVRLYAGGTGHDYHVWDSLRVQSFKIPFAISPDSILLDPDSWVLKQIVAPPVSAREGGLPTSFSLQQNYPNPFNPITTIRYSIPDPGFTVLKVFDVAGREVETLVYANKEAGSHVVVFDARSLASGVYYYRLHSNMHTQIRKMVLIK